MLRDTSSKQVYCISIRDNCHIASPVADESFFKSPHECVVVTIDNHFCLQVSKYFSLEFSKVVIRSQIRAFLPGATAHWCEMMILSCKSSFSDYSQGNTG